MTSSSSIWVQRNPSHWSHVLGQVAIASVAKVDAVARRAQSAQAAWAAVPAPERHAFLAAWAE
ncbi:MAG: aldehyde dehydrogenase family protein, partial [Actinomycetota bacterium]|nr:aldehyde dehydrogenase family protein [Actinomycetota bacterium]